MSRNANPHFNRQTDLSGLLLAPNEVRGFEKSYNPLEAGSSPCQGHCWARLAPEKSAAESKVVRAIRENMKKYHVALSFAGEDREYVENVAKNLRAEGVNVFYDKFEEVDLWGKDLYSHLSEVYRSALFTVFFISEQYTKKAWPNHERKSAQARALIENKEYILPAYFDESIEVPGLPKTIGFISLIDRTAEQLAELIVKKLHDSGVRLKTSFLYSKYAKADVDYPLRGKSSLVNIINRLKSHDWYTQNPAIDEISFLDWGEVDADGAFVLGRNVYQVACGGGRAAISFLSNLRGEIARLPDERALDLLNGMFYEIYFNCRGEFREHNKKGNQLGHLFNLQTVEKYEPSIMFIRRYLEPFRSKVPILPSTVPETLELEINIKKTDSPFVESIKLGGRDLLSTYEDYEITYGNIWRLTYESFTIFDLKQRLAEEWAIPVDQLLIVCPEGFDVGIKLRMPKGKIVKWPA